MKFGTNVDKLFNGEPVSFQAFAHANAMDISAIERAWNEKVKTKYGTDKLEYQTSPEAPKTLDIPPSTPRRHDVSRLEYLKSKFNLEGFGFEAWTHNGNWHKITTEAGRKDGSRLIEAIGTEYKGIKGLVVELLT